MAVSITLALHSYFRSVVHICKERDRHLKEGAKEPKGGAAPQYIALAKALVCLCACVCVFDVFNVFNVFLWLVIYTNALMRLFFLASYTAETSFTSVITQLLKGDVSVRERLSEFQSLSKQLAHILHFALTFDDLKVSNCDLNIRCALLNFFYIANYPPCLQWGFTAGLWCVHACTI